MSIPTMTSSNTKEDADKLSAIIRDLFQYAPINDHGTNITCGTLVAHLRAVAPDNTAIQGLVHHPRTRITVLKNAFGAEYEHDTRRSGKGGRSPYLPLILKPGAIQLRMWTSLSSVYILWYRSQQTRSGFVSYDSL